MGRCHRVDHAGHLLPRHPGAAGGGGGADRGAGVRGGVECFYLFGHTDQRNSIGGPVLFGAGLRPHSCLVEVAIGRAHDRPFRPVAAYQRATCLLALNSHDDWANHDRLPQGTIDRPHSRASRLVAAAALVRRRGGHRRAGHPLCLARQPGAHGAVVPARRLALAGRRARTDAGLAGAQERGAEGDRRCPRRPARPSERHLLCDQHRPAGQHCDPRPCWHRARTVRSVRAAASSGSCGTLCNGTGHVLDRAAVYHCVVCRPVAAVRLGALPAGLGRAGADRERAVCGHVPDRRDRPRTSPAPARRRSGARGAGNCPRRRPTRVCCGATGQSLSTASASWASRGRPCSSPQSRRSPG